MAWKIPLVSLVHLSWLSAHNFPCTPSPLASMAVQKAEQLLVPVTKYFLWMSQTRLNVLSEEFLSSFITRISLVPLLTPASIPFSCTQSAWHHLLWVVGIWTQLPISFQFSRMPNLNRQSRQIKTLCVQFIWHARISVVQMSNCFNGWKLEPGLIHLHIDVYTRLV